jgi:hypothetical protein
MANFIAGPYTATYRSLALGQAGDGFRLSHSFFKRLITGDSYAQAPQDEIYQGAEMFVSFRLIQYDAAGVGVAMWPYGNFLSMGSVGRVSKQQQLVGPLVLTAVSGTPAATTPATMSLTYAILSDGFPIELLFAPELREVPIRMRVFPHSGLFGVQT